MECRPSGVDRAYLWVNGIHPGEGKLCLLAMIGVPADARNELAAPRR